MFRIESTFNGTDVRGKIYYQYRSSLKEKYCAYVIEPERNDVTINILNFHLSMEGCQTELVTVSLMSDSGYRLRPAYRAKQHQT